MTLTSFDSLTPPNTDTAYVSQVADWNSVNNVAGTTTTKPFQTTLFAGTGYSNQVEFTPAAGIVWNRPLGVTGVGLNPPVRAQGAGGLADPIPMLRLNFTGQIDFKFATPLDATSGILTQDIDVDGETLNFFFFDAAGACIDPTGWTVKDIGNLQNSHVTTSNPLIGGCTSLTLTPDGSVQTDPLLLIVPGQPVTTLRVRSNDLPNGSRWALTFAQSAKVQAVPPTANPNTQSATPGATVTVNVLGNDTPASGATDPAQAALDPASVQIVGATSPDGKVKVVAGEGTWTVNADGSITFTPVAGFTSAPTPIAYTVADVAGDRSAPAALTITLTLNPAAVPTLGEWGLMLMGGLLGALGLRRLRPRRTAA